MSTLSVAPIDHRPLVAPGAAVTDSFDPECARGVFVLVDCCGHPGHDRGTDQSLLATPSGDLLSIAGGARSTVYLRTDHRTGLAALYYA